MAAAAAAAAAVVVVTKLAPVCLSLLLITSILLVRVGSTGNMPHATLRTVVTAACKQAT